MAPYGEQAWLAAVVTYGPVRRQPGILFRSLAPGRLSLEGVLRLWDARTGSYAVVASSSVPLRVCVHGPAGGTWSGLGNLRVLLVADVLTRIAELQGL